MRHALRARGVVLVSGGRVPTAFDLYTDRKLRYGIKDGAPDPATLEQDKQNLTDMVKATMESWHGRKVSPVYQLMPNLQEPDWKSLRIGDVREFWEQHDAWERRIELARKAGRIGDLLVLADEAPVAAFRAEAWIKAGEALRKAERFNFALEQLERGLEIEPHNLKGLQREGHLPAAAGLGGSARPFAGSRARALPQGAEHVSARSGDLGAARSCRQGCLDRRLAPARQDAGADARRRRLRRRACCARRSTATPRAIAAIPATITPASMR